MAKGLDVELFSNAIKKDIVNAGEPVTSPVTKPVTTSPVINNGGEEVINNEETASVFNFGDAVSSLGGESELNSYLYDSGLQNIFKDYEENIGILNKGEQQSLEDAYYIREMSKKYLGEYASNVGQGDVSGQLLDIYGSYQRSKADIKANYDALELNLTQEYRKEKAGMFEAKMREQYDMALSDFSEGSQEIMFNAVTGNFGEEYANSFEFLDAMRNSGEMLEPDYQTAYGSLYGTTYDQIERDVSRGYYGDFETADEYIDSFGEIFNTTDIGRLKGIASEFQSPADLAEIERIFATSDFPEGMDSYAFLENIKDTLNETQYNSLYLNIYGQAREELSAVASSGEYGTFESFEEYASQEQFRMISESDLTALKGIAEQTSLVDEAIALDDTITNPGSESYIGSNYNFDVLTPGANVNPSTTYGYQDASGNKFFSVDETSGADPDFPMSGNDLQGIWSDMPENEGEVLQNGDIVTSWVYSEEAGDDIEQRYVYTDNAWHRMVQAEEPTTDKEMEQWILPSNANELGEDHIESTAGGEEGQNWSISNEAGGKGLFKGKNFNTANSITVNDVTYKINKDNFFDAYTGQELNEVEQSILDKFSEVHGVEGRTTVQGFTFPDSIKNLSFIMYEGKFYGYQDGKIYSTDKQENE